MIPKASLFKTLLRCENVRNLREREPIVMLLLVSRKESNTCGERHDTMSGEDGMCNLQKYYYIIQIKQLKNLHKISNLVLE